MLRTPQLKLSYAVPKRSEAELSKSRKLYVSKLGDVTKGASLVILLLHSLAIFICFRLSMRVFDYLFALFLYSLTRVLNRPCHSHYRPTR